MVRLQYSLLLITILSCAINIVPLIPVALLFVALYAFAYVAYTTRLNIIDGPGKWYLLYIMLSVFYCALINVDLSDPSLYRRELKYFFPFMAFLLFSNLPYKEDIGKKVQNVLIILVVGSIAYYIVSLFLKGVDLSFLYRVGGSMWEPYRGDTMVYLGQFLSHSAAGGFFATTGLMLYGFYKNTNHPKLRRIMVFLCLLAVLFLLFIARSRAYMLATFVVVFTTIMFTMARQNLVRLLLYLGMLGGFAIASAFVFYKISLYDFETDSLDNSDPTPVANVKIRYILWDKAIHDFLQSPIIGGGISRFDDNAYVLGTFPDFWERLSEAPRSPEYFEFPLVKINIDDYQAHTDQHAHNIYLHLLAEGGILFFGLTFIIVFTTLQRLSFLQKVSQGYERGLAFGAQYSLYGVLIASFFGNNFHAIIPMVQIMSICGYLNARYRYKMHGYMARQNNEIQALNLQQV